MPQNIIILEGHDNSGKTTIGKALSKKMQIPIYKKTNVKFGHDFLIDLFYSVEAYLQFLEQTDYSVIFDRLYPSEYVYSTVLHRHSSIDKIIEVDERFADMGACVIILEKDRQAYKEDDVIDTSLYDRIKEEYRNFAKGTKCKVLILNTTDQDIEKQIDIIMSFVNS